MNTSTEDLTGGSAASPAVIITNTIVGPRCWLGARQQENVKADIMASTSAPAGEVGGSPIPRKGEPVTRPG
jgi:hypothetical protein